MEPRCPLSFSSSLHAPQSSPLAFSTGNATPSNTSTTAGGLGFHCRFTRSRGLGGYWIPNAVLRQSSGLSTRQRAARGDDFANTSWDEAFSSRSLPAQRCRVGSLSKVGFFPRPGSCVGRTTSPFVCKVKLESEQDVDEGQEPGKQVEGAGQLERGVGQVFCWVVTVVYVGWLFLLPYAPVRLSY